ncbi:MAG: hypothetical protein ABIH12_01025 [Pseudomonadota bacterium]
MIDWNALGTWAAVAVALGLSLRETFARRRERSARHLVTVGEIFPAVSMLKQALEEQVVEARAVNGLDSFSLRELNHGFADALEAHSLESLRPRLDAEGALPEHMLFPLCKAITLAGLLTHNARARASTEGTLPNTERERELLDEWMEQSASIQASLGWFLQHAQELMATRRWQHPEVAAGYAVLSGRYKTIS